MRGCVGFIVCAGVVTGEIVVVGARAMGAGGITGNEGITATFCGTASGVSGGTVMLPCAFLLRLNAWRHFSLFASPSAATMRFFIRE